VRSEGFYVNEKFQWHQLYINYVYLTSALLWDITQHIVVIPYRRVGKSYPSYLQDSINFLTFENGTDRLSRNVSKQLPLYAAQISSKRRRKPDEITYTSVSQPLWDRGPVNSFLIRRGPGPNKFTRKYLSNFFLSSYIKLT